MSSYVLNHPNVTWNIVLCGDRFNLKNMLFLSTGSHLSVLRRGKKRMSENNFERICKVLISRVTLNDAKREKESKKTWSSALAAFTSSRVENRCAARHTHMLTHISLGCLTCLFYQVHQLSPALTPPPGLQISVCPPQILFNWLSFFFYQQDAPTLQNLRFILLLQF